MRTDLRTLAPLIAAATLSAPLQAQALSGFDQKFSDPQGALLDGLGRQVLIEGDHLILTAPAADDRGAAFAFRRIAGAWVFQQKFTGSTTALGDFFGFKADLDGDRLLIGSQQDDDQGFNAGEAYLFEFDGSQWVEAARLQAPDGGPNDSFGSSVALGGDLAVIGASADGTASTFVSGSAYVFRASGGLWAFEQKLLPPAPQTEDEFGWAVATDGQTVVVSAIGEDEAGVSTGGVFAYAFDGAAWTETERLLPSDGAANDRFGWDVALDGDRLVVGAPEHGPGGAVYVFDRVGGAFVETAKVVSAAVDGGDSFGWALALQGPVLVVGAPGKEGAPVSSTGTSDGAIFRFNLTPAGWVDVAWWATGELGVTPPFLPQLGAAVALDGDTVLGGAPFANSPFGSSTGAAYRFTTTPVALAAPAAVAAGQPAEFTTWGGTPGELYGLALSGIGGSPIPLFLLDLQPFGPDGARAVTLPTPVALAGFELQFTAAGFWQPGVLGFSGERTVSFQ